MTVINNDDHPDDKGLHATQDDHWGTEYQVNVSPKTSKGDVQEPYPNTDDNMFFASGKDEKIIRAKRELRDKMK